MNSNDFSKKDRENTTDNKLHSLGFLYYNKIIDGTDLIKEAKKIFDDIHDRFEYLSYLKQTEPLTERVIELESWLSAKFTELGKLCYENSKTENADSLFDEEILNACRKIEEPNLEEIKNVSLVQISDDNNNENNKGDTPIGDEKTTPKKIICQNCGSDNIVPVISSTSKTVSKTTGGFSAGNGCCGFLLMGPIGLLCGLFGGSKTTTETEEGFERLYWICKDCGNKQRDKNNEKEEDENNRINLILSLIGTVALIIGIIIFYNWFDKNLSM